MSAINDNQLSVSLNEMSINEMGFSFVYPLEIRQMVLVVPEAMPYVGFAAYIRVLGTFDLLGYSALTIVITILFLSFIRFNRRKKFQFFESVCDVLNLLMNDNSFIRYQRLSSIEIMVILPLTFLGLIVVNGILSAFQSYLTQPISRPQIESAEDLYNSPLDVYTYAEVVAEEAIGDLKSQFERGNWNDRVKIGDVPELSHRLRSFDRSISQLVELENALVFESVQKQLNIYGYHIPRLRLTSTMGAYYVNTDFPFMERVNEIIHWTSQSGLREKWQKLKEKSLEEDFFEENRFNFRNSKKLSSNQDSDSLNEMTVFVVCGWVVGTIVFIIEIFWKKISESKKTLQSSSLNHGMLDDQADFHVLP